jgi:ribose transport system ATP-binding protein
MNLSKRFGGEHALNSVSLEVFAGEVHGLLGQNGSGKSTLLKILAGFHSPEEGGSLAVNGTPVRLPLSPGQFRELGMTFVHQDLALVPTMTVLENLRIGDWAARGTWSLRWSVERRKVLECLSRFGVELDPDALVADLRPVDRALLAIVRAMDPILNRSRDRDSKPGLLVLDEPTVYLPRQGIERLFSLVRQMTALGSSVLFVSHDLSEVREITDRVTVLRDGSVHGTTVTAQASDDEMVEMIIGRKLSQLEVRHHERDSRQVAVTIETLESEKVRVGAATVGRGEVLGLTGLAGSGFEDVPYLLFGAMPATAGMIVVDGRRHELRKLTPRTALDAGIALVPADRQRDGGVATLSVEDNVTISTLDRYRQWAGLGRRSVRRAAANLLAAYEVRPDDPRLAYSSLSGGNQQKALLAKWLQLRPSLLLLHEPTQGVDIGSRQQIFEVIRSVAREGAAVVCASSDAEQLASICDRVLIFGRGIVVQELVGDEISKERIVEQCYSSLAKAALVEGGDG